MVLKAEVTKKKKIQFEGISVHCSEYIMEAYMQKNVFGHLKNLMWLYCIKNPSVYKGVQKRLCTVPYGHIVLRYLTNNGVIATKIKLTNMTVV